MVTQKGINAIRLLEIQNKSFLNLDFQENESN